MKKLISILGAALLLSSCAVFGNTLNVPEGAQVVELIDVVDGSAIGLAEKVEEMSANSKDDIYILINSPGGNILPGFMFVDAIEMAKARGVKVKCVSGVLAASMAFITLAHCSERYVFSNTLLLFHPVSLTARSLRITEALPSLIETSKRELEIEKHLMEQMNMSPMVFYPHNMAETGWTGDGLADATKDFITVVDDVTGLDNLYVFQKSGFSFSGELDTLPEAVRSLYQ